MMYCRKKFFQILCTGIAGKMIHSVEWLGTTKYDTFYRAARNTENKGIKLLKGND